MAQDNRRVSWGDITPFGSGAAGAKANTSTPPNPPPNPPGHSFDRDSTIALLARVQGEVNQTFATEHDASHSGRLAQLNDAMETVKMAAGHLADEHEWTCAAEVK